MSRQQASTPSSALRGAAAWDILVPRRAQVLGHLKKTPHMVGFLEPICKRARKHFRPDVELSLEVYRDPEIDDEYLTLYVRQSEYDLTIMDRIDEVREQLAALLNHVSGSLLITTDFCPPRGSMGNGAMRARDKSSL